MAGTGGEKQESSASGRALLPLEFSASRNWTSPLNNSHQNDNDSDDQQDVNEATQSVGTHHSQ